MTALPPRPGVTVAIDALGKRFGPVAAVDGLNLTLAPGTLTALLGPSGCGKSTTLALLAGLLAPDTGDIRFDGRSIGDLPAQRRPTGLVFQKPLLFPHLSVAQNVAFGLRMRRTSRPRIRSQVSRMLERVQLSDLAERRVGELSGGQEQRVALARALVLEPRVLLLDEPFSQLDAELRVEMRALVRRLHEESEMTTVFVTHDQGEAVQVGDSIALMLAGRLVGSGPPERFYTRPPSLAAARFFAATNEIPGQVRGGVFVDDTGAVRTPTEVDDGAAVLVIRPEALRLDTGAGFDASAGTDTNTVSGVVASARFAGAHIRVEVTGPVPLVVHTPVGDPVPVGLPVRVRIPKDAALVFALD